MTIPQLLKSRRIKLRILQKQLSAETGLSQNYISDIEHGKSTPTLETVNKLLKALGVDSVEKLIENEFKKREL